MSGIAPPLGTVERVQRLSLIVGLVAAIPCAACAFWRPDVLFPAYLIVFLYCWMIACGWLALNLLHHLTGGGWGVPIRRPLESASATLPLLAVLSVPFMLDLPSLYPWARSDVIAHDELLRHKLVYLNVSAFQLRAVVYFVIWIVLMFCLNVSSRRPAAQLASRVAGPGMVLWGLTVTFSSMDWGMSLEPHWISSVYGVLFMAGQFVAAMATVIVTCILLRNRPSMEPMLTTARLHDLGNFLMAFTLFWTYITFTQFLVIWSGNLPEETPWYLNRGAGGWQYVSIITLVLHFAVPFILLLFRTTKRNAERLLAVALLLLMMRLVDLYWQVIPAFSPGRFTLNWMLPFTVLAVGGIWLAEYLRQLSFRLNLPIEETVDEATERHGTIDEVAS